MVWCFDSTNQIEIVFNFYIKLMKKSCLLWDERVGGLNVWSGFRVYIEIKFEESEI